MTVEATYPLEPAAGTDTTPTAAATGDCPAVGSGLTDATGAADGQNLAHCDDGLSKLLAVFKDKPRLESMICAFLDQAQEAENAMWELFTERVLNVAEGVQLDGLGDIVGEPRKGRTDDVFRQFIRVRIKVNRSNGKLGELYEILLLALGEAAIIRIRDRYPAGMDVNIDSDIGSLDPADLLDILLDAKGAAIALRLIYSYSDSDETFTFDTVPGSSDNATGFGSTTNGAWGGDLGSVLA